MNSLSSEEIAKLLAERVETVSAGPGVYLMKDENSHIIYVGKAKNLKKRLSSYFRRESHPDMKTGVLVKKIVRFDTILTDSEKEALILEASLIRKHKPRYNVILKDDKRYPLLRIDVTSDYPNITIARRLQKDKALYFGPYASSGAVHQSLKFINKIFKLRKCNNKTFQSRSRPCLYHQIGVCLGPCCNYVDPSDYRKIINEVALFLNGRTPELIRQLKQDMAVAAEDERFEDAAQLRDRIYALDKTLEKQVVVSRDMVDRDIIALTRGETLSLITVLSVRTGVLSSSRHVPFHETMADDAALMGTFISQYYEKSPSIPAEILCSELPEHTEALTDWLSSVKSGPVRIYRPQRGEKVKLVDMANKNGLKELDERVREGQSTMDLLIRLKKRLTMERLPERIECFDNSNISGTEPVAGMVVFKNGKPLKSAYRKYTIKTVFGPDDYASMHEILTRRFGKKDVMDEIPDLLMVDGGKGQLNIALAVLKELGLENELDVVGIAKKDEQRGEEHDKIYKPNRSNPLNFGKDQDLLFFLQSIRDETHRFAITFHRAKRMKQSRLSVLDDIPGIGPVRKKALLQHFGGISGIMDADEKALCAVDGITAKAAHAVIEAMATHKKRL